MDVVRDVYAHLKTRIVGALTALQNEGALPASLGFEEIELSPPRGAERGDVASNAALVLARPAGLPQRELAARLAAQLARDPDVARVEVAGPGFLNITLVAGFWQRVVFAILQAGPEYGRAELGAGAKTNVEYVSTNPTGPVHVGHGRGAVFGDALANLLAFTGHAVTREYYVNDAGQQVDVLARSVYLRYREALGEAIGEIPAGLYPGDYLKPVGAALAREHGRALLEVPEERWLAPVRERAVAAMLGLDGRAIRTNSMGKAVACRQHIFPEALILRPATKCFVSICALDPGLLPIGRLRVDHFDARMDPSKHRVGAKEPVPQGSFTGRGHRECALPDQP